MFMRIAMIVVAAIVFLTASADARCRKHLHFRGHKKSHATKTTRKCDCTPACDCDGCKCGKIAPKGCASGKCAR